MYTRIAKTNDLVAAEARYHKNCYTNFFREYSDKSVGRPVDEEKEKAFKGLCHFIETCEDCCQFSLEELETKLQDIGGNAETWSRL